MGHSLLFFYELFLNYSTFLRNRTEVWLFISTCVLPGNNLANIIWKFLNPIYEIVIFNDCNTITPCIVAVLNGASSVPVREHYLYKFFNLLVSKPCTIYFPQVQMEPCINPAILYTHQKIFLFCLPSHLVLTKPLKRLYLIKLILWYWWMLFPFLMFHPSLTRYILILTPESKKYKLKKKINLWH